MSNQLTEIEYQKKVKHLLSGLEYLNENEGFVSMEFDLLEVSFSALLASEHFTNLDGGNRVFVFDKYKNLKGALSCLQNFFYETCDYKEVA